MRRQSQTCSHAIRAIPSLHRNQLPRKLLPPLSQLSFLKVYLLAHLLPLKRIPLFHHIVGKALSYKAIVPLLIMYFLMDQPRIGRLLLDAWATKATAAPMLCKELRVRPS